MLTPFFTLAMLSPGRQQSLRIVVVAHLLLLATATWAVAGTTPPASPEMLGHVLMVAGIVEGATLVGWRLAQMPKSQALEFLLVSQLRPFWMFVAEALVGIARLALVTLSGLPVLTALTAIGLLDPIGMVLCLVMPFTWGSLAGLALAVWAYEPKSVRRVGEVAAFGMIVLWLIVGVLAGEHLKEWLRCLPWGLDVWFLNAFLGFHHNNPFAVLAGWLRRDSFATFWDWSVGLELAAVLVCGLLVVRGGWRLFAHFHELHYRPATDRQVQRRPVPEDRPLSWWSLQRVTRYAGRSNLYLAGGFGLLYALYTVAGAAWPAWMGRQVFVLVEQAGGIPLVATGLVVLAAVPAAFQYGLWDHSVQDRCRRLELLLLTRLDGRDYFEAAAAAAWKRGWGYFAVASLLWISAVAAGKATPTQGAAAMAAGVLLWALYFAMGFRGFAAGDQANGLGSVLTLGLPLVAFGLYRAGLPSLAALAPPGNVYAGMAGGNTGWWLAGALTAGLVTLVVTRRTLASCDEALRRWYDENSGRKVMT